MSPTFKPLDPQECWPQCHEDQCGEHRHQKRVHATATRLLAAELLPEQWLSGSPPFAATHEFLRLWRPKPRDTVLEAQQRTCEHEFKVRAGERVVCRDCTAEVAA